MSSLTQDLATLLSTVRTPGDFHAAGTIELPLPHLEVDGVGRIALPVLPVQAEQLIAVATQAPYGRGEDTLIDTGVRRTWQIGAEHVHLHGKHWVRTLDSITAQVAQGLGVTGTVVPELYKLLVYDPGSFFVSHRDTEKTPGMFATLVVALPSEHTGGELVVRHKGREVRLDLRSGDPSEVAFAAFYADCVHEVLPLTAGCRLVLVYNLLRAAQTGPMPQPPNHDIEQAGLAALLQRWGDDPDNPHKLVYVLEHAYTPAELSFRVLKGADAAAAAVLTAAAQQARCDLHVALLTIEQSGSAEHAGYTSRGRGGEEIFEVGEIFEDQATLGHWSRPDGSPAGLGMIPFEDEELSPPDVRDDMEPDEEYFHEATGNEGASFERSYRRAALVLWPQDQRLAVISRAGLAASLPYLDELTRRWAESGTAPESPLWQEAHALAGHMLSHWPRPQYRGTSAPDSPAARMLALLSRLQDQALIDTFVAQVCSAGMHALHDNGNLVSALALLPPARAGELIDRVVAGTVAADSGVGADLLAQAVDAGVATGCLSHAARTLLAALPGDPARAVPAPGTWPPARPDASQVVALMVALPGIDAALADRAVDHLLAWPQAWNLDALLMPALRVLLAAGRSAPAIERLRQACLAQLRIRVALPLEAPRDWARAAQLTCGCEDCRQLGSFLASATQQAWTFKAAELRRSHLAQTVAASACDLDCVTERRGSPHGLVCTKNQASHQRRVVQRRQDLKDLAQWA